MTPQMFWKNSRSQNRPVFCFPLLIPDTEEDRPSKYCSMRPLISDVKIREMGELVPFFRKLVPFGKTGTAS